MSLFADNQESFDNRRLTAVAVVMALGFLVLMVGLGRLQIVKGADYSNQSKKQSHWILQYPAERGKILDRNRFTIAENRPQYNLLLDLVALRSLFTSEYYRIRPADRKLSQIRKAQLQKDARYQVVTKIENRVNRIIGRKGLIRREKFEQHYYQLRTVPLLLKESLTEEERARFEVNLPIPEGIRRETKSIRNYPRGRTAAHLIGYVRQHKTSNEDLKSADLVELSKSPPYVIPGMEGELGIEKYFDEELKGRPGVKLLTIFSNFYRYQEEPWIQDEPGKNVILTLDLQLQMAVEKILARAKDDVRGAVIVMDAVKGDILAMVSLPDYDPNIWIPRISTEDFNYFNDADSTPAINRATYARYAPGSIFKILISLGGLNTGLIDPEERMVTQVYHPYGIKDLAPAGYYNFQEAFARSSNYYFIECGLAMGARAIIDTSRLFGLGNRTGIVGIPPSQELAGRIPNYNRIQSNWYLGDTANLSIGQGEIDVTLLQMSLMTSAVANGGKLLKPRLVLALEFQTPMEGPLIYRHYPPEVVRELGYSNETLQIVQDAMRADVADSRFGTGKRAAVVGMEIHGKTGTAETTRNGKAAKNVWFVSYCPYLGRLFTVAIVIEATTESDFGSNVCAPVAKSIYLAIRDRMNMHENYSQLWNDDTKPLN